jgi:hypothetical protein
MNNQWGDGWQRLCGTDTRTEVLQVPHGWLVRVICEHPELTGEQASVSMCFVADYSERQPEPEPEPEPERWRQVADRLATALESVLKKPNARKLHIRDPEIAVISTALAIYRRAVTEEHEGAP